MRYVYLLRSSSHPDRHYTGVTDDLKRRIGGHNSGDSPHTARYRPWRLVAAVAFEDDAKAHAFERYLKTGSGRAFARRHFSLDVMANYEPERHTEQQDDSALGFASVRLVWKP